MKRNKKNSAPRLLLRAILRGELTLKQFRSMSSGRYFKSATARLRCVDDARVKDFLDDAPVRPEDATLAVQLYGEERRRYDEIKNLRLEAEKKLFTTESNDEKILIRKKGR